MNEIDLPDHFLSWYYLAFKRVSGGADGVTASFIPEHQMEDEDCLCRTFFKRCRMAGGSCDAFSKSLGRQGISKRSGPTLLLPGLSGSLPGHFGKGQVRVATL